MVSRSNLSDRAPYGGVLGRAYKGPSGPGNVTPPGMENKARVRGQKVLQAGKSGPIDAGGVPVPSSGAQTPGQKPRLGKPIFSQLQSPIEQSRSQQAALSSPVEPVQGDLMESMMNPAAPRLETGGNVSRGTPTRRGSAASISRRITR